MSGLQANAALLGGIFILLASPALFRRASYGWVLLALLILLVDFGVAAGGGRLQSMVPFLAERGWNWLGKGLSVALAVAISTEFSASGKLHLREMGLSFRQAPGTGRVILLIALPALALQAVWTATLFGGSGITDPELIVFQATMPSLAEGLIFRGIILALLDRAFVARVALGEAKLGYGALVLTVYYGLSHSLGFNNDLELHANLLSGLHALPIGFLLVWLRLRTGSIIVPIAVHGALNVVSFVVPHVF